MNCPSSRCCCSTLGSSLLLFAGCLSLGPKPSEIPFSLALDFPRTKRALGGQRQGCLQHRGMSVYHPANAASALSQVSTACLFARLAPPAAGNPGKKVWALALPISPSQILLPKTPARSLPCLRHHSTAANPLGRSCWGFCGDLLGLMAVSRLHGAPVFFGLFLLWLAHQRVGSGRGAKGRGHGEGPIPKCVFFWGEDANSISPRNFICRVMS